MRDHKPARNASNAQADAPGPRPFRARTAAALTAAAGLLNIYLAWMEIPHFDRVFHERLPNQTLPAVTAVLLDGRWVFVVLACLWPVLAIGAVRRRRAQLYLAAVAGLITVQVAYTVIALYLPLLRALQQTGASP